MPSHDLAEEVLAADIRAERNAQLAALGRYGQPAGLAAAFALAIAVRAAGGPPWILFWAGGQGAMLLIQHLLVRRLSAAAPASRGDPRWERYFACTTFGLGLLWGALALFAQWPTASLEITYIMCICGVTTGSVVVLGTSRVAYLGYVVPTLVGFAGSYLLRGGTGHITGAVIVLAYLVFLAGVQRTVGRQFSEAVTARLRNEALVERLRRADTALKESLASFQLLFDLASVGIAEVRDRRVVHANRHLEDMLHVPPGGLRDTPVAHFLPSDPSSIHMDDMVVRLAKGETVQEDIPLVCRDGGTTWVSLTCRAIDAGRPGVIAVFTDITDRRAREIAMHRLAHEDGLTGLPNRRHFEDRLRLALPRCQRGESATSVLLFDLDGFKQINDAHGHEAGDAVLIAVGKRLVAGIRASDLVCRLGGDEFVVLLDSAGPLDASAIATKLIAALREPIAFKGMDLRIDASVGISSAPADGSDSQTLLKVADAHMYRAKHESKSQPRRASWLCAAS